MRTGELHAFNETLNKYRSNFESDSNYTLVLRARHNVIKAGVRRMAKSYSKNTLTDVAAKLELDTPEDAEFIVAKVTFCNFFKTLLNAPSLYLFLILCENFIWPSHLKIYLIKYVKYIVFI